MSQPTPYARLYDLAAYARNNPAAPYNAAQHDAEFDAIETSLDETIANLGLIQADDGGLDIGVVTPYSLNTAVMNMIGEWRPVGPWLPSQVYAVLDMVTVSFTSYVCCTAHTSSSFAIDYAAGYWQPVNQSESGPPSSIQFAASDRILGRVSAGAGAGEEIVCTAAARSILDDATVADICTTLGLGSGSSPTFNVLTVANIIVSGLTANSMIYANASKQVTSTAAPTNGQLLVGSTGVAPVLATLTGTANQVTVTNGAGSITLALPQSIAITSTPTFATVNLTNLAQGSVVFVGASSALSQDTTNLVWDDTNNRLGVGQAAPTVTLDVLGVARIKGPALNQLGRLILEPGLATTPTAELQINALGMFIGLYNGTDSIGYNDTSFMVRTDAAIGFTNGDINSGTLDTTMYRDAADVFAQRRAANPQAFRVYNTFTSATNFERADFRWNANVLEVGSEKGGGGGTARALALVTDLTQRWSVGATSGHFLASTDNTYDIGAAAATRPRRVYIGTQVVLNAPVTETNATRNVLDTDNYLICNRAGTITLTLPTPTAGKSFTVKTITANTVVSAASDVIPRAGGAAGTAILAANAGNWATLVANGSAWEIMAGTP